MSSQFDGLLHKSFPMSYPKDLWILSHEFYPNTIQRVLLEQRIQLQARRISDYERCIRLNEGDVASLCSDRDDLCAVLEANRSLLAPIRKLNNACLLNIFSYLQIYPLIATYRVCRRWMLLSKETPWLWGDIRLERQRLMPYKAIAKHILNSEDGFLYLDLDVRRFLDTYDALLARPPSFYSILQLLQACQHRFRTLRIVGSDGVDWLFFTQSTMSFPHLVSLSIDYEGAGNSLMELQLEHLPCLEELTFLRPGSLLKHIRFPMMSSLRAIVIERWYFDQNALKVISLAPNLTRLHLSFYSKLSEEDERRCLIVPMMLPSLEDFELSWLGPSTSLIPKAFLSVLQAGDRLKRVSLDLNPFLLYQTLSGFPEYPHSVTQLRIERKLGTDSSIRELNSFHVLSQRFLAVSSLEIYSNFPTTEDTEGVLHCLHPGDSGSTPFPSLKKLCLVNLWVYETLANLIEARHNGAQIIEEVDLDHCGLDHITLAALRAVETKMGVVIKGIDNLEEIPDT